MSKGQLIQNIRAMNAGAAPEFLERFQEGELKQYLDRLLEAKDRRRLVYEYSRKHKAAA